MRIKTLVGVVVLSNFLLASAWSAPKPKYGAQATVLSLSHEYFRRAAAPDFWALAPYYTAQQDDRSCSVATITMLVNAARVGMPLTADDELVTQKGVLEKAGLDWWKKAVGEGGHGVTLDELAKIAEVALKAYGVNGAEVKVVHTSDFDSKTQKALHEALVQNEKSSRDFILLNFIQGIYTGDAPAGHIAPLGAYDSKTKRVLVMDPDRQWYEPYWVSEDILLHGMATDDPTSKKSRGYLWVKLPAAPKKK